MTKTFNYAVNNWGAGYFDVDKQGHSIVTPPGLNMKSVRLLDIVEGMKERGLETPVVLRIENLLGERIKALNEAFASAIKLNDYNNIYRGVFPIKVNQQAHVVEEIASFGESYHHGFEAGSKAELLIALSHLQNNDSLIICNGYKDSEFFSLGLHAVNMGLKCIFVIETPAEIPTLVKLSKQMNVEPILGVRIRSSICVDGHWQHDSGDKSIFGLSSGGLNKVIRLLEDSDMLHCLQLLHCHIGSQIPNIRNIRNGVLEASRYFTGLVEVGANMKYIDLGGGLGVDYEGSNTNSTNSMNYQLDEYCVNVVETLAQSLDEKRIEHPIIITESGRSTVAYSSVLLFDVIDVRDHRPMPLPEELPENSTSVILNIWDVLSKVDEENLQECYNDAIYYRDEVRELFLRGQASLNERTLSDNICLAVFEKVADLLLLVEKVPAELENLPESLADVYYGNFSLFQSLPDIWAIDQVLPIMPIHRLNETPTRDAVIADLTCDCDGKITRFVTDSEVKNTIKLHEFKKDEPYYLGVFLVGAYQETLGDLHNLFGDTNVVSVHINNDGSFDFVREFHGDSISDVLGYVEYNPKNMIELFRKRAERSVKDGTISAKTRTDMMKAFKESLDGYTYFEK